MVVSAHRKGDSVATTAQRAVNLDARSATSIPMASMFEWFVDFGYAFQFAEAGYDILSAELNDESGAAQADAVFFPTGPARQVDPDLLLEAKLLRCATESVLAIRANKFAQTIRIEMPGFIPEDNYFHLLPGGQRQIRMRDGNPSARSRGTVSALNAQRTFDVLDAHE
jgi:beta-mannosidase